MKKPTSIPGNKINTFTWTKLHLHSRGLSHLHHQMQPKKRCDQQFHRIKCVHAGLCSRSIALARSAARFPIAALPLVFTPGNGDCGSLVLRQRNVRPRLTASRSRLAHHIVSTCKLLQAAKPRPARGLAKRGMTGAAVCSMAWRDMYVPKRLCVPDNDRWTARHMRCYRLPAQEWRSRAPIGDEVLESSSMDIVRRRCLAHVPTRYDFANMLPNSSSVITVVSQCGFQPTDSITSLTDIISK